MQPRSHHILSVSLTGVMGATIFSKWLPGYPHLIVMKVTIFSKWLPPSHCDESNHFP